MVLTAVSVFLPLLVVVAVSLRTAWLIPSLSRLGRHHSSSLTHPSLGYWKGGRKIQISPGIPQKGPGNV